MEEIILYFYSIEGENVHKIKLQDVNELAAFALTMEPLDEVSASLGYSAALAKYFELNPNSEYKNIYDALVSSMEGRSFLDVTIQIASIQRNILLKGATEKNSKALHDSITEYRRLLNYSQSMVDSTESIVPGRIF